MRKNWWTDTSAANFVDYVISWLASSLAAWSCGQAVGSDTVSILGLGIVTVGSLLSFLARSIGSEKKWTGLAGPLYCVAAWAAFLGVRFINGAVFEEGTFPMELLPSSWLYWMILFGTFFLWRDGTLIFHLVPALAMFGFVGCYDTFRPVVVLFFIFLVCFAIMFARAHAREMQTRALQSGYFMHTSQSRLSSMDQSEVLRDGPWRWAAGAEWALGSALVIVLLSAVGAPVIQAGAKPIAGFIAVRQPTIRNAANRLPSAAAVNQETARVGTGAVNLSNRPYFEIKGDVPEYLRVGTFNRWTGQQWQRVNSTAPTETYETATGKALNKKDQLLVLLFKTPNQTPGTPPGEYRSQFFEITSLIPTSEIPQAGNSPVAQHPRGVSPTVDGVAIAASISLYSGSVRFDRVEPKEGANAPKKIPGSMLEYISKENLSPLLVLKAKEVTQGKKNDFERMESIRMAVSRLIKYNTKVDPTPAGKDPAEYACFETREGYCDVFATSVVQMARAVGIPCRYTIGYLPGPENVNSVGTQILLESDRHAWAEAFFDGVGWVPFDATIGADVVPGGDRRNSESTGLSFIQILGWTLNGLIVIAIAAGAFAMYKAKTAPRTAEVVRAEMDRAYLVFVSNIWRYTGQRRLLSETTNEYLERVSGKLGEHRPLAVELANEFTNRMFSRTAPSDEQVAKLQADVAHFAKQLRAAKK